MTEISPAPHPLVAAIIANLRNRYAPLNRHYEAAWTESFCHFRCWHRHESLIDAAKCAMPNGAGWYVFAVENDTPQQLMEMEEQVVNDFRFAHRVVYRD